MRTIWKFPLNKQGLNIVEIPVGFELISAGLDDKIKMPCVWAVVDTVMKANTVKVKIFVCGTGHEMPKEQTKYIGTATDGMFFWHVFEVIR